jgi:hypothetical protein
MGTPMEPTVLRLQERTALFGLLLGTLDPVPDRFLLCTAIPPLPVLL